MLFPEKSSEELVTGAKGGGGDERFISIRRISNPAAHLKAFDGCNVKA